jgi:hypothetical protein
VVVTHNKKLIAALKNTQDFMPIETLPKIKAWTDSYNNLFDVLR